MKADEIKDIDRLLELKKKKIISEIDHLIELRNQAQENLDTIKRSVSHYQGKLTMLKNQIAVEGGLRNTFKYKIYDYEKVISPMPRKHLEIYKDGASGQLVQGISKERTHTEYNEQGRNRRCTY